MELGQDLAGVELEKTRLVWPNLVDPDVRIPCLGCLRDCRNMTCGVRPADDRLRDRLLRDGAGGLREMGWESEVSEERSLHASYGPPRLRQASRLCFFRGPTDIELRVARFPSTACGDESVHQLGVNSHRNQAVPEPAGHVGRARSTRCDQYGGKQLRLRGLAFQQPPPDLPCRMDAILHSHGARPGNARPSCSRCTMSPTTKSFGSLGILSRYTTEALGGVEATKAAAHDHYPRSLGHCFPPFPYSAPYVQDRESMPNGWHLPCVRV